MILFLLLDLHATTGQHARWNLPVALLKVSPPSRLTDLLGHQSGTYSEKIHTTYVICVDKVVGFPNLAPDLTAHHLWCITFLVVPYFILLLYSYQYGVDPSVPLTHFALSIYLNSAAL